MTIGTRSVLYGAHAFWLHPWVVAMAWWKLYGFPWDPRLWVCFALHDLGYIGKRDMDGEEGEEHPYMAARVVEWLFNAHRGPAPVRPLARLLDRMFPRTVEDRQDGWWGFCAYHSRYLAKRDGVPYSRLCVADKLAVSLLPAWVYLPMVKATGELEEYMAEARRKGQSHRTPRHWYRSVQQYCAQWAWAHREGVADMWTEARHELRAGRGHG